MIIRGTTPTLTFGLPFDHKILANGFVIIRHNKKNIIEKPISACECNGWDISVTLTQEETLKLAGCPYVDINLVVKTQGGERLESIPIKEEVGDTSKEGVI